MADHTAIEWTDATWNPIVGCSVVSPGCANCYAMRMAARIETMHIGQHSRAGAGAPLPPSIYAGLTQDSKAGPVWSGGVRAADDRTLTAPLRWKRPRKIFVNSMGDLFHESVPDAWIDRVFAVMALSPRHTFQVLTKRSKRMREYFAPGVIYPGNLTKSFCAERVYFCADEMRKRGLATAVSPFWALPNVWLGVSCEDQTRADERVPDLLATPAAVRFVSAEPLLGEIDFTIIPTGRKWGADDICMDALRGPPDLQEGERLDWIIAGGESGPGARPMHPDWARSIREQCAAAGVPFFFKQWGEWIDADEWLRVLARGGAICVSGLDCNRESPLTFDEAAELAGNAGFPFEHQSDGSTLLCVGKRRASRLLDGVEHNAFPEPRA